MSRTKGFPENGELVVCTVTSVKNFGAFVTLDEYDGKEGFVHVRDVATGWVKYIRDFIREGQKIVCKVLGVDSSKGHIDLSLKSVNDHQKREKIQQWKNENKAEKLVEIIAERMGVPVDEAYGMFGEELTEAYDTLYEAFESAVAYPKEFMEEFSGEWIEKFMDVAKENVTPPFVEIDSVLEMTSSAPNGIDHIKKALNAGLKTADDANVTITSIGSPRYRVVVTASEYKDAEEIMKKVTAKVMNDFTAAGGVVTLKRESK
ncbi:translation initiation factor 2 subunit alpha [Candidatus Methanoplasma termitum]|uniref:Translation initiation factor 2 subunit alpha n=1 Tax=Candidatus Methanoplasma termitum TaxID=1577791 RepID=A0A0A7LD03_9ARCH|nr:translation initiation factor IF-2 subunit alpha [Candidatus Methanoplasma termitum]AIZ56949.1 translation initiation factor 2 subunit alpha [Candidatus Methanoplasma termitum]MCL2333262.1 translation initiation factor IF-2 subunit alpha [Candidatus Methanoplasma sp.]